MSTPLDRTEIFDLCWSHMQAGQTEWARFELYVHLTRTLGVREETAVMCVDQCITQKKIDYRLMKIVLDKNFKEPIARRRTKTQEAPTR